MDKSIERGAAQLDAMPDYRRTVKLLCGANIKPQPINWLWDGFIPQKLTILAGEGGTGKTTLALGLAAILTSGGNWPDGQPCEVLGNVLVWSSEDNPYDTLAPRLIASGADMSRCHFIDGITENGESLPFDPSQDIGELHKAVERIGGVSMLIIDPIVSAVAGDMHRANDVRRSLQCVVDFAETHNCAVIGITHFAKGSAGKNPAERIIGSQAFGALPRMALAAAKSKEGDRRILVRAKTNIAPENGGITYDLNLTTIDGGIKTTHVMWGEYVEGTPHELLGDVEGSDNDGGDNQDDLERLLIDLLTENGGKLNAKLVRAEISDAGYSWSAANRAKTKVGIESSKEKGTTKGGWTWFLPKNTARRFQEDSEDSEDSTKNRVKSSESLKSSAVSSVAEVEL